MQLETENKSLVRDRSQDIGSQSYPSKKQNNAYIGICTGYIIYKKQRALSCLTGILQVKVDQHHRICAFKPPPLCIAYNKGLS